MIFIFISFVFLFLYAVRIAKYRNAWISGFDYPINSDSIPERQELSQILSFSSPLPVASIIIPFKDEYSNLSALVEGLSNQSYPETAIEVICVNDHSFDGSMELIESLTEGNSTFRILSLPEGKYGKKAALDLGIAAARSDIIITTDADCVHGENWIRTMISFYHEYHARLISGPVKMTASRTFFSKFQSLEYLSLTGIGAASFLDGRPVMCSAANLCFDKSLYMEARADLHKDFPSGDDMFLMLYLNKNYPGMGRFIKSREAIVATESLKEGAAFFRQRARWSSKAPLYRDWNVIYLASLVLFLNLSIIALAAGVFFSLEFLVPFILVVLLKSLVDYSFLKNIAKFMGQPYLMKIFLPSQIIYPFYSVIIALSGFFVFFTKRKS